MATCNECGGILGRDCFNPAECAMIGEDMRRREYEGVGYASAAQEIEALRFVLRQIVQDLPANRDWLDPQLEARAKDLISVQL